MVSRIYQDLARTQKVEQSTIITILIWRDVHFLFAQDTSHIEMYTVAQLHMNFIEIKYELLCLLWQKNSRKIV